MSNLKVGDMNWMVAFKIHVFEVSLFEETPGRLLFVIKREHCFAKKSSNISGFSLKFVINLSSCNNGGIKDVFLISENVRPVGFGLVMGSDNFLDKRA